MTTTTVAYLLYGPPPAAAPVPDLLTTLDALGQHSPTLEPDHLRTSRRQPPLAQQAAALLATAREQGWPAPRLGLAPTPGVARLAARHGRTTPTILTAQDIPGFLAPVPLTALDLPDEVITRLALVGLQTLGAVAALPPGALGDYLGALGPALEALARGTDDRPLTPHRPPLVLTARHDLEYGLDDHEQLRALLTHLVAPLLCELQRQGLVATRATLTLTLALGPPLTTTLALGTAPCSVSALVVMLLDAMSASLATRAAVHTADPSGGVTGVAVSLSAPRPLAGRQASFFDVPQGQAAALAQGVAEARQRSDGALGYLRLVDPAHPLPERRYQLGTGPPASPGAAADR
jgi:hypothetical protein